MKTFKSFIQSDEINKQAFDESDAYDKDVKASPKPHDKEAAAQRAKLAALAARKKMMTNKMSEAESHQSKTTMKHIDNPNAAEKKAAKDIEPGIKGVKARLAMLQAAKDRGALKNEEVEEIDELSTNKLLKYKDAANKNREVLNRKWDRGTATEKEKNKVLGHERGVEGAAARIKAKTGKNTITKEDIDAEILFNLYNQLDESNQEIFLAQLEEDVEVLLAFAKTIAEE